MAKFCAVLGDTASEQSGVTMKLLLKSESDVYEDMSIVERLLSIVELASPPVLCRRPVVGRGPYIPRPMPHSDM